MSRGFTLMEMLVVLVILGIVAAAGVAPALVVRPVGGVDETARDVSNLLTRARTTAVTRGDPVAVWLDVRTGRYWAEVESPEGLPPLHTGVVLFPPGVTLEAGVARPTFRFAPRGDAAGDAIVVRGRGRGALVGVNPWTGTVYVRHAGS